MFCVFYIPPRYSNSCCCVMWSASRKRGWESDKWVWRNGVAQSFEKRGWPRAGKSTISTKSTNLFDQYFILIWAKLGASKFINLRELEFFCCKYAVHARFHQFESLRTLKLAACQLKRGMNGLLTRYGDDSANEDKEREKEQSSEKKVN